MRRVVVASPLRLVLFVVAALGALIVARRYGGRLRDAIAEHVPIPTGVTIAASARGMWMIALGGCLLGVLAGVLAWWWIAARRREASRSSEE